MSSPSTPCQGMSDREEPLRDIGGPGMKPPVADFINLSSFTGTGSWELELKKLHWFLIHSLINYNTAHLWRDFWTSLMLSSISPLYLDSGQNHTVWHSLSFCFFPCQTCWDIFVDLFLSKTLLNNFKTNTKYIFHSRQVISWLSVYFIKNIYFWCLIITRRLNTHKMLFKVLFTRDFFYWHNINNKEPSFIFTNGFNNAPNEIPMVTGL